MTVNTSNMDAAYILAELRAYGGYALILYRENKPFLRIKNGTAVPYELRVRFAKHAQSIYSLLKELTREKTAN